ncbi:MAG: diacylglycerol/lipid kinase family protein [Candidatus Thorarchaeota archaeon]
MQNNYKWLAVVNPTSAAGRTLSKWKKISHYLEQVGVKFDETKSEYVGHAIDIVKNEIDNYDGILAVGGDGTVNEVINGILSSSPEKLLAILPTGTGNDLANTFQLHLDLTLACKTIISGKPRKIDVGMVQGKDFNKKTIKRFFGGVASFGFDADVAYDTNASTKILPGTWNYLRSVFKNWIRLTPKIFQLTYSNSNISDKRTIEQKQLLCAIGNGKFYGGGMMICPDALVTDNMLDITLIDPVKRIEFLKVFPSVYSGTHKNHPAVHLSKANQIFVSSKVKIRYQVDGEVLGYTPVKLSSTPSVLQVLAPQNLPDYHLKGNKN